MIVETIKLYPEREDVTLTTYVLQDSPELLDGANPSGRADLSRRRLSLLFRPGSRASGDAVCGDGLSCLCAALFRLSG